MLQGKIVEEKKENIELSLPVNPAYVSSARLTASAIANRMGFDIECTEDIKSAVSEACAYLIHKKVSAGVLNFKIQFLISERTIEIILTSERGSGNDAEDTDEYEYGIRMIRALMDSAEIREDDDGLYIYMKKNVT